MNIFARVKEFFMNLFKTDVKSEFDVNIIPILRNLRKPVPPPDDFFLFFLHAIIIIVSV